MKKRAFLICLALMLAIQLPLVTSAEEVFDVETQSIEPQSVETQMADMLATESQEMVPQIHAAPLETTTELTTAPTTEAITPSTEPVTEPTEPVTEPTEPVTEPTEPVTEPTEPVTEPTQPVTESTETEPPKIPTVLEIDSKHIYTGMDTAYEHGYLPRIENGVMQVVLPLKCTGSLWGDQLDATISLDASSTSPFVVENFQKTFYLQSLYPINSNEPQSIYLVTFDVLLSDNRKNGTYPVTVNTSGFDSEANPIKTSFTLYITITDGKVEKVSQPVVETATAEPVVYISKTVIEPESIQAGQPFSMIVTLKNSITTKFVQNMLVTVDTGNVQIDLEEDSNIFPVERIDAGGETELTIHFSTDISIPSGKYPINFSFKYDSSKTLNLSSTSVAIAEIKQPANIELVMPRFPQTVTIGETVPVSFQVMNMGRSAMYNVRCVVGGYGFAPANTGYIGTMEAGSSATTDVELYIIALNASPGNENGSQYGSTTGTVTLIYEDEAGQEFSQEMTFDTTVNRPVVQLDQGNPEEEEKEETASQWWISVVIIGCLIGATIAGYVLLRIKRGKRKGRYM